MLPLFKWVYRRGVLAERKRIMLMLKDAAYHSSNQRQRFDRMMSGYEDKAPFSDDDIKRNIRVQSELLQIIDSIIKPHPVEPQKYASRIEDDGGQDS